MTYDRRVNYRMLKLNRKGQTLVEYVLIISLITVVAIAAVKILGGHLKDKITETSCGIMGKDYIQGAYPHQSFFRTLPLL